MPNPKPDRRINRSREALQDGLFALMLEKRYEDITIQDIIDRANVSRSTFYAHYQDKEDLAVSHLIQMLDSLADTMEEEHGEQPGFLPGRALFEHIAEQQHMFKAMMQGRGLDLLFQKGQEYWNQRVTVHLKDMLPPGQEPNVPIPILAHYVAGTFVNLLKWWIDNKMPYSSDRMTEIIDLLITPSVQAGLFGKGKKKVTHPT